MLENMARRWPAKEKNRVGTSLMQAGIRHEIASVARLREQEPGVSLIVQAAVAAHHGKLSKCHKKRWLEDVKGEFAPLWKLFAGLSDEVEYASDFDNDFDEAILRRYEYAGPRSLLQMCDHRASAGGRRKAIGKVQAIRLQLPRRMGTARRSEDHQRPLG